MTATDGMAESHLAPSAAAGPTVRRGTPEQAAPERAPKDRVDQGQDGAAQEGAGAPAAARRPWVTRAAGLAGRHWLLSLLLLAGIVLRWLSWAAYHPALLYVDSLKYLYAEWPGSDPLGYKVLLKVVLFGSDLGFVAALQHVLGLAMAVALYTVLVRRGCARWLAALAVAPVLLDAYQLQMEQMIMPDICFEAAIAGGLVLLLWRPAVTMRLAIAAGIVLGASATLRQIGEILIVPAVIYVLLSVGGWRQALSRAAVLIVAFVVPIFVYSSASLYQNGHFRLASGSNSAPGRLMAAADCATLKLPAGVKALCPTPAEQAKGPDWLEHSSNSPLNTAPVPPGMTKGEMQKKFDSAVEHQQPLRVIGAVARDAVRLFTGERRAAESVTPISRWQFQTHYPTYAPEVSLRAGHQIYMGIQRRAFAPFHPRLLRPSYGGAAQVDEPIASFLRSYQLGGGYAPGYLLAFCVLAGVAGALLALRRKVRATRSQQLALACLLFTLAGGAVLLASDLFEFSWRYQIPALVTLPLAGALAIAAYTAWWQERRGGAATSEAEPSVATAA